MFVVTQYNVVLMLKLKFTTFVLCYNLKKQGNGLFKNGSCTDFQNKKGTFFYLELYRARILVVALKDTVDDFKAELLFPVRISASSQRW